MTTVTQPMPAPWSVDPTLGLLPSDPQEPQQQFLACSLGAGTNILLPVVHLVEVLNFPLDQVTAIPHLPPWVRGVYNWRGEVLWVVDLGQLLGLAGVSESLGFRPHAQLIILQGRDQTGTDYPLTLGMLVVQVKDLERCRWGEIQSPPATTVTPELAPFLQGYWLKDGQEVFLCLSVEAMFAAMPQGGRSSEESHSN
jgi:positive phototaxis protein PixI